MSESPIHALRSEYDAIASRLDAATSQVGREAVKREIIAFFKHVDGAAGRD